MTVFAVIGIIRRVSSMKTKKKMVWTFNHLLLSTIFQRSRLGVLKNWMGNSFVEVNDSKVC